VDFTSTPPKWTEANSDIATIDSDIKFIKENSGII
jgi:hypothetical protein